MYNNTLQAIATRRQIATVALPELKRYAEEEYEGMI